VRFCRSCSNKQPKGSLVGHITGAIDIVSEGVSPNRNAFSIAQGTQVFGPHAECAAAGSSPGSLQQLRDCSIPCTKEKKPHARGSVACPQSVWGDCEIGCMQRRKSHVQRAVTNSSGVQQSVCEVQAEERECRAKMCVFDPYSDCAYIVRMTLPNFDMRLWSSAWKDEMIEAMAATLKVKTSVP
jgi:hypothetical protein